MAGAVTTPAVTRWWWVRHAPIAPPNVGRINGNTDVDVQVDDTRRLAALAARLPEKALWVTSALSRTEKTARALGAAGPFVRETALNEQDFGVWTGRTWTDIDADDDVAARAFWENPAHTRAPSGESFADQVDRVAEVMLRLSAENPDADIVAVAHAGTIRAALAVALDADPAVALAFKIDTLGLTRMDHIAGHKVGWRGGAWAVAFVNGTVTEDAP